METREPFFERSRSRRRVVRWVVRASLAGLALAAAVLLRFVVRAGVQGATVAAVRASGGEAYYDWEMTRAALPDRVGLVHDSRELTPRPGGRPPWPEALVKLLGPDVFGDVVGVELRSRPVPAGREPAALVPADPAERSAAARAKADALMARVGRLGGLRCLSVADLPVTDEGMGHLQRLPRLESLRLAFLPATTGKGFRSIGGLRRLKSLDVEALPLGDGDFSALRNLTALRVLRIQRVRLTDRGMEHLGGLPNLSKLTLAAVEVKNVGLVHLRGSRRLSSLKLQMTSLDDLEGLRGLTEIRDLDVSRNPLRDEAIVAIADLPDLRRLDLSRTFVKNACLEVLAKSPRLTLVRARDTRITHKAVEEFRKTHARVEFELKPLRTPSDPGPKS